jgi:DNA-binding phage protein
MALTEELLNELLFTRSLGDYLEKPDVEMQCSLSSVLNAKIEEKGMKKSEVIRKAKLDTTFGYQIFSGERNPTRDKVLQLAIALELTVKETQRLLTSAGVSDLYPKLRRDAIIIYCVNKKMTVDEIDETLFAFHEETICSE